MRAAEPTWPACRPPQLGSQAEALLLGEYVALTVDFQSQGVAALPDLQLGVALHNETSRRGGLGQYQTAPQFGMLRAFDQLDSTIDSLITEARVGD